MGKIIDVLFKMYELLHLIGWLSLNKMSPKIIKTILMTIELALFMITNPTSASVIGPRPSLSSLDELEHDCTEKSETTEGDEGEYYFTEEEVLLICLMALLILLSMCKAFHISMIIRQSNARHFTNTPGAPINLRDIPEPKKTHGRKASLSTRTDPTMGLYDRPIPHLYDRPMPHL